jgi:hypothetical protein
VRYEEMKKDLPGTVRAVASHIGVGGVSEGEMAELLPRLSVEYMKANVHLFEPKSVAWVDKGDGFSFVRKGAVGDGRREFGEDDERVFKEGFERFPPPPAFADLV